MRHGQAKSIQRGRKNLLVHRLQAVLGSTRLPALTLCSFLREAVGTSDQAHKLVGILDFFDSDDDADDGSEMSLQPASQCVAFSKHVYGTIEAVTKDIFELYDAESAATIFGYTNACIRKLDGNNLQDEINFLSMLREPSLSKILAVASLDPIAKQYALDITHDALMKANDDALVDEDSVFS